MWSPIPRSREESASGKILYEEYHPYGTSAYRASNGSVDVSARRYRYTGKERDEETGLYYNGARYLAAWLGRWTSADPIGIGADGPGLYNYTRGSPVNYTDPSGTERYSAAPDGVRAATSLDATFDDAPVLRTPGGMLYPDPSDQGPEPGWSPPLREPQGVLGTAVDVVGGGLAHMVAGVFGADTSSGEQAEARQAAWAAYDENTGVAQVDAATLPTRMNQDLEASLHVASIMAPGVLLKYIGRGLSAMAAAEARILVGSAPKASGEGLAVARATAGEGSEVGARAAAEPAKAGAGGSWQVIGETPGGAVGQSTPVSCGAACGEMLSGIPESQLIKAAGAPTDAKSLAGAMGTGWRGGYVGPGQIDKLMGLGRPWSAEFYEGGKLGHFVVVEGRQGANYVIRDPWSGGTTYKMAEAEFHRVWTGNAVFK